MVLGSSGSWLFYLNPDWSTADLALGNIAVRQHCCYARLVLLQFDARLFVAWHIVRMAELSWAYLLEHVFISGNLSIATLVLVRFDGSIQVWSSDISCLAGVPGAYSATILQHFAACIVVYFGWILEASYYVKIAKMAAIGNILIHLTMAIMFWFDFLNEETNHFIFKNEYVYSWNW